MVQIAYIIAGLITGFLASWFLLKSRIAMEWNVKVSGLEEKISGRESEINGLKEEKKRLTDELNTSIRAESDAKATLIAERKSIDEKIKLLMEAEKKLTEAFDVLASQALRNNNQSFLDLAQTKLKEFQTSAEGDLEKRQTAINALVDPVKESLGKFEEHVNDLEKNRIGAYQELLTQVQGLLATQNQLKLETSNLVRALSSPKTRGRWGEIQLKRVVEMAGMIDHCDFFEQPSVDSGDGRLRPDMIIRLPGGTTIVIDAKTPLAAYLEAIEATDDTTRQLKLADHARQIRNHVNLLSKKSYWEQFDPTPTFVVLFLPGEIFFSAALEQDPALIEIGVNQQVIISTPTTLIALLKAVSYGWRQEKVQINAQKISDLGKDLYDRICTLIGKHFTNLGSSLGKAVEHYNQAIGSLESSVLPGARKFRELEAASPEKELKILEPIEQATRQIQAPELLPLNELGKTEPRLLE